MRILEVNNISKSIGNKKIIDNVSFSIDSGTIIGLVGNNGVGKSSILKAITGLFRIDEGSITINGYNLNKEAFEALSKVGSSIEESAFYDFLSGYDNLFIYCNEKEINSIVEFIGLKDSIFKKVGEYSLGMKQRLSLGIALANNPDLIILDEPTNGLDPKGIIELRNKLIELKKNGKAIIVSSHILSELDKLCDQILFINEGKIIKSIIPKKEKDSLENIYSKIEKEYYEKKYLC